MGRRSSGRPAGSATRVTGRALANETRLAFDATGTGPPLVLIPNTSSDRRIWRDQVSAFAASYRTVRYDPRGWGGSPRRMGVFRHAQDLGALLDRLGIGRAALVGDTWGADIALDLALDRPDLVAALILVEPLVVGAHPRALARAFDDQVERLMAAAAEPNVPKRLARFVLAGKGLAEAFAPDVKPKRTWRRRWANVRYDAITLANLPRTLAMACGGPFMDWRTLRTVDPAVLGPWMPSYHARNREPSVFASLEQVAAPTLIVRGVPASPILMELDEDLRRRIAGAEVALLANATRVPQLIEPDAFNAVVLDFLRRVYPPPTS